MVVVAAVCFSRRAAIASGMAVRAYSIGALTNAKLLLALEL